MGNDKSKDDIEDWDDFNFVDLSSKRYVSDETREKHSIRNKNLWENPEYRKKLKQHYSSRGHTTEIFISKSLKKFGDRFDYSKVEYVNSRTKVTIICPEHGEFETSPNVHLLRVTGGCGKCGIKLRGQKQSERYAKIKEEGKQFPIQKHTLSLDEVIVRFREVHGDKYDYSLVKYVNRRTKVTIICPEHGEFEQLPSSHIRGRDCQICANKKKGKRNLSRGLSK
jgi:hypothetical protein